MKKFAIINSYNQCCGYFTGETRFNNNEFIEVAFDFDIPVGHDFIDGEFVKPTKATKKQKTIISLAEFRKKLTIDEKVDIELSKDIKARVYFDDIMSADDVDLKDNHLSQGMKYFVAQGIIKPERMVEILTPEVDDG